ncbi:MAG: multiubiquitin domain-containing protein [Acidobacteria bacterium]|nr:multiubiquitin domain-containing protein [Acidobacteriota bacterium]
MENLLDHQVIIHESEEPVDLEALAKAGRRPPRARRYRIRIDRQYYVVEVAQMTGRQLLELAGKVPPESYMISQKFAHGQAKKIGLDDVADFTTPGVERFMTLPLDQTEGGYRK